MKNIILSFALVIFLFTTVQANYVAYESHIFVENSFFYVEEPSLFCEQQNLIQPIQKPKKNNFVRFMRPSFRTIKTISSMLSWVLGAVAIYVGFDWFDRRESLTNDEKKNKLIMISAWLVNKTLYHLSDYALEEMDNADQH